MTLRPEGTPAAPKSNRARIFCGLILLFFAALLFYEARYNAPVQSEDAHLASGVSHWFFMKFDLYRVNPPLVRAAAALPVLGKFDRNNKTDWFRYSERPFARSEYNAGIDAVSKRSDSGSLIFRARCFLILVFVLPGLYFIYHFPKGVFGSCPAVLALLLWCFNPYVIGHGSTLIPDVISALFAVAAACFFWGWLRVPNSGNAFAAGVALGLAELTKFTLLIFYPLFPVLWLIYRFPKSAPKPAAPLSRQFLHLILIFAVSLLVINMGYLFEGTGKPLRSYRFQTAMFTGCVSYKDVPKEGGNRFDGSGNLVETALGYLPVPLPKNFVQGIDTQRLDFEKGLPSYLRGTWTRHGWWYYYLYALLLKTPLGTLGLFLLAVFCTLFLKGCNGGWRDELAVLLPGLVLLAFVSSQTGFSVHSRYAIPALAFLLLWTAKVGRAFTPEVKAASPKLSRAVRLAAVLLIVWSAGSSLWVYPRSIAYFNGLAALIPTPEDKNYAAPRIAPGKTVSQKIRRFLDAGPLNGPRHLLESNIDWGQDLYAYQRWRADQSESERIFSAVSGTRAIDLTRDSADGYLFSNEMPGPGRYTIGVNHLYDEKETYRYFLNFTAEDYLNYTTYIYNLTQDDIDRITALEQPNTE